MANLRKAILPALMVTGLALGASNASAAPFLPAGDCTQPGGNCLQFGDFQVYSLAYLQYLEDGSLKLGPGDLYHVRSSGQPINDSIVIASHPAGRRDNQDLGIDGIDDAYDTPNSVPGVPYATFLMDGDDPDPTFFGDNVQRGQNDWSLWDIRTDALRTYLDGNDLVFFFNLNEENKGGLENGQDMYVWAEVFLSKLGEDDEGNAIVIETKSFVLNGNTTSDIPEQGAAQTSGKDDFLPNAEDMWAWVHGEICVSPNLGLIGLRPCSDLPPALVPDDARTVDQNLGANTAAFAIYNGELNELVKNANSGWDVMTVDLRMTYIDNGYEQLFIRASQVGTPVSAPGTLMLLGAGLAGLGMLRRRKQA